MRVSRGIPWRRFGGPRATFWIVVNKIDGTSGSESGHVALRGRRAPHLGYYDEWYVFAADPGELREPLPSFVNDGNLTLLFASEEELDRDLLCLRTEIGIEIGHAMLVSQANAIVWGLEELLIAERPGLGLAPAVRNHDGVVSSRAPSQKHDGRHRRRGHRPGPSGTE